MLRVVYAIFGDFELARLVQLAQEVIGAFIAPFVCKAFDLCKVNADGILATKKIGFVFWIGEIVRFIIHIDCLSGVWDFLSLFDVLIITPIYSNIKTFL